MATLGYSSLGTPVGSNGFTRLHTERILLEYAGQSPQNPVELHYPPKYVGAKM